jgi:hypothetical protein
MGARALVLQRVITAYCLTVLKFKIYASGQSAEVRFETYDKVTGTK